MSSLAQLFVVGRRDVRALVRAAKPRRRLFGGRAPDTFEATFAERAREVGVFEGSGDYLGVAVSYLDDRGVPVFDGELVVEAAALSKARGVAFLLLTPAEKEFAAELEPDRQDVDELRRYCEDFWQRAEPEAGRVLRDALAWLGGHLATLEDDAVLVLRVG